MPEMNYIGLVNKPPIDEIINLDLVNKPDILEHHGILKQRWGIRRYQNPDGTLTEEGKARLRARRQKFEAREAKKKIREEKREARAKARKEKRLRNPDPNWINKNMHKLTNEEISKAIERIKMKKTMEDIQKERLQIGKNKADTIIGYGDSLNNILRFINSDAGKAMRQKLGFSTDTIFDFNNQERKKQEEERKEKEWNEYKRKEAFRREKDFEDWSKKDTWKRDKDYEYAKKREADKEESKKKDPWYAYDEHTYDFKFSKDATASEKTEKPWYSDSSESAFDDEDEEKKRKRKKKKR